MRRHQHLVFEKLHQVRRVGPRVYKLFPGTLMLCWRDILEPDIFADVYLDRLRNFVACHLDAVIKEAVQEKTKAILLCRRPLKVNNDRVDPLNLLKGVCVSVANGNDKYQQIGVLLGDLREDLNEVEGPVAPWILLGIRQPVIPRLEFVQDECGRCAFEHFKQNFVTGNIGLLVSQAFPFALTVISIRVLIEEEVPQEFVMLTM